MSLHRLMTFIAIALIGGLLAGVSPAEAKTKTYKNPTMYGKLLDGCYSWPGSCKTKKQANEFCEQKGYDRAVSYKATNKFGAYQTIRLGDEGVCTASCTVMTKVKCMKDEDEDEYDDDDDDV